jgi:hypothetical protein
MVRCFIVIDLDAANHAGSNVGDVGGENAGGSTGADSGPHAGVSLFHVRRDNVCLLIRLSEEP